MREYIHDYELNQLNDADRDRFEEHLMSCSFCTAEAQAMQPLTTVLTEHREGVLNALREDGLTFDQIRRQMTMPRETVWDRLSEFFRNWYGRTALVGAAAVAVIVAVLLYPHAGTPPYLADLSYELPPYESNLELRGEQSDQAAVAFEMAMDSYRQGHYAVAIKGIQRALDIDPDRSERWLYLGVSQYATHDARNAVCSLKKADANAEGLTKIRARWFLAQSYLYLGKVSPARPLLEWIIAQGGEHSEDAEKLLATVLEHEQARK
jgi:tetratricopeptide (TPR) repeat protein